MELYLNLVSMKKIYFKNTIKSVKVPGIQGDLHIHPQHAPLLTKIKPGIISIFKIDNTIKNLYISKGILEVQPFLITILGKKILKKQDINIQKTNKLILKIKTRINETESFSKKIFFFYKLKKQLAKLKLLEINNI